MTYVPQFIGDHGVAIYYRSWAVGEPRGVVQLVHGLGEHSARYGALAEFLNTAGYSVYAQDLRGHGETARLPGGEPAPGIHRLGEGGLRTALADVSVFTRLIREENPGVPVVLLGHSLGSLLSQLVVNTNSTDYDGLVLSGTAFRMPGSMNGGDLSRRHRPGRRSGTGFEWLTRDPVEQAKAAADPLMFEANALRELGVADGLRLFGLPGRHIRAHLPVLILAGSDDTLGGAASVRRLARSLKCRARLLDVEAIVFPDARHEVFNETNRDEVHARLADWLDAHT